MAKKTRTYTPQTLDAAEVLGSQLALARRARGWTVEALGERIGVSSKTVTSLERGAPTVSLGIAFEAAAVLGVALFGAEGPELARLARQGRETLALLPRRVRTGNEPARDDF